MPRSIYKLRTVVFERDKGKEVVVQKILRFSQKKSDGPDLLYAHRLSVGLRRALDCVGGLCVAPDSSRGIKVFGITPVK